MKRTGHKTRAKKVFWVDLPIPHPESGNEWENVGTFDTYKEAAKFLFDGWGIVQKHAKLFITEGRQ